MAAAFKAGPEGSTGWLWVRLGMFVVLAAALTQLAITVTQLRSITLGRVPLGWPLPGVYYITDFGAPGGQGADVITSATSHFEVAPGGLVTDLAIFAALYLLLFLALRFAWVVSKPKPRPLED
ncbi:MAG TPA: hypothetical protein VG329_00160 [Candidatus Dormibacteraeota bacterium]|jgi:hypothetical protein|nr:hypothetical protein [Candidatus Dormibacteraeota bacterium]